MTSVENILEDELRSFVVERRYSSEELEQAHSQRPPVHHEVCGRRKQDRSLIQHITFLSTSSIVLDRDHESTAQLWGQGEVKLIFGVRVYYSRKIKSETILH